MWKQGRMTINGVEFKWQVKCYDNPSAEYGMEGAQRISKLWVLQIGGKEVANYDRGWDVKPESAEAIQVVDQLKAIYG